MRTRVVLPVILALTCTAGARSQTAAARSSQQSGAPARPAPGRVSVPGSVEEAKLIHSVAPVYPEAAKMARVEGVVRFAAVVGADGAVTELKLVSGPPMLVPPAMAAVKQWRYQTTLLNGNPVEVETEIDVNFVLQGSGAAARAANANVDAGVLSAEKAALEAVDPATAADIRQLAEVAGVKAQMVRVMTIMMQQLRPLILGKLPPSDYSAQIVDEIIADALRRCDTDEFINLYIPVMARHFSDDEVKGLIAFYQSPLGRHYLQEQPALLTEYQAELTEHWQKVDMPEVLSDLERKMKADHPEVEEKPQ